MQIKNNNNIALILRSAMQLLSEEIRDALVVLKTRKQDTIASRCIADPAVPESSLLKRKRQCGDGGATARLTELHRLLDAFGLRRSRVQKQLHTGMVGSVMQRIYEGESDAEMKFGAKKFNISSCRQQFMVFSVAPVDSCDSDCLGGMRRQ